LADPQFGDKTEIDMLVGGELFFDLILNGKLKIEGLPTLKESVFGWIAVGNWTKGEMNSDQLACHLSIEKEYSPLRNEFNGMKRKFRTKFKAPRC
jgi:hypothetical protein